MNRILTPDEMARSMIEMGARIAKEHGLTDSETNELIYAMARCVGNCPWRPEVVNV